jgi:hypothetical protein
VDLQHNSPVSAYSKNSRARKTKFHQFKMKNPIDPENLRSFICCFLISAITAFAQTETAQAAASLPTLSLTSSQLSLKWVEQAEGWTLSEITAEGTRVANPQGFSNVLYSEKSPPKGAVGRDEAGDNFTFYFSEAEQVSATSVRLSHSIQAKEWFPVFSHVVNNIYRLPSLLELQENSFSLTNRVYRMLHFLQDDERAAWNTWEVFGDQVGATGSKNADAGTMSMIAHSANDPVMQRRMEYIRNFKLAQQQTSAGFFQGAALGEYGDEDGFRSEVGNWIEPLFTTYYTMMDMGNMLLFEPDDLELRERLRLGAEKLLDWQHEDGSWDV